MRFAVVDGLKEDHRWSTATAASDMPLLTGSVGSGPGLPTNLRRTDRLAAAASSRACRTSTVLWRGASGSCSDATRAQAAAMADCYSATSLDPVALPARDARAWTWRWRWLKEALAGGSGAHDSTVAADEAGADRGSAGGRGRLMRSWGKRRPATSSAPGGGEGVLDVPGGRGPDLRRHRRQSSACAGRGSCTEIDPGVPWTRHLGEPPINVAFKSGNFGAEDFFLKALEDADS